MTCHRLLRRIALAIATLPLVLTGCCLFEACPVPGFVGVPEAVERSADLELPLDAARRQELIAFLAQGDRKRSVDPEDVDPARLQQTAARFASLLQTLERPVPDAALDVDRPPGTIGALAALADAPGRLLTVHDARVDEDVVSGMVTAIVRDGFVFAFYWRQVTGKPGDGGTTWRLGPPRPGFRTAVVVFRSIFADPRAPQ